MQLPVNLAFECPAHCKSWLSLSSKMRPFESKRAQAQPSVRTYECTRAGGSVGVLLFPEYAFTGKPSARPPVRGRYAQSCRGAVMAGGAQRRRRAVAAGSLKSARPCPDQTFLCGS